MNHRTQTERTPLILVSGHTFGGRAFEGLFSSRAFLDGRVEVPLMIGLDDSHASATVGYQSLGPLAAEQGVPFVSTSDGRLTSLAGQIRDAKPAYILVIGWSHLIGAEILSVPAVAAGRASAASGEFGCIGMHPTKLPQGRGQAPIPWTIIKGYEKTALTVFFLEPAADTGPIIAQYDLGVYQRETAASLFYRIAHAHFTAGLELAESLGSRQVGSQAQDQASATRWPRRRPRDGEILSTMTYLEIDSLVRSLLGPYPRAYVPADSGHIYICGVEFVSSSTERSAGQLDAISDGRVRFRCGDAVLDLIRDDNYSDL